MNDLKKVPDSRRFSILNNMDYCWVCGAPRDHIHEVYGGPERENSKSLGLCCGLCAKHHNDVHSHKKVKLTPITKPVDLDLYLKEKAQEIFEENYGREKFMKYIHRSYL